MHIQWVPNTHLRESGLEAESVYHIPTRLEAAAEKGWRQLGGLYIHHSRQEVDNKDIEPKRSESGETNNAKVYLVLNQKPDVLSSTPLGLIQNKAIQPRPLLCSPYEKRIAKWKFTEVRHQRKFTLEGDIGPDEGQPHGTAHQESNLQRYRFFELGGEHWASIEVMPSY